MGAVKCLLMDCQGAVEQMLADDPTLAGNAPLLCETLADTYSNGHVAGAADADPHLGMTWGDIDAEIPGLISTAVSAVLGADVPYPCE
jgi:hypothetical protein